METKALPQMIEYMDHMSNIVRCPTWDRVRGMSVGEHTFRMTVIAMVLADTYNDFVGGSKELDTDLVLRMCLLHDFEEAVNGDTSYHVKNRDMSTKAFFAEVEYRTIEEMFEHCIRYREDAHGGTGIYNDILKAADMLELLSYAWREVRMGNEVMAILVHRCVEYLYKMTEGSEIEEVVMKYATNVEQLTMLATKKGMVELEKIHGVQS